MRLSRWPGAEFEIRAAADIYTQEGANKEKLYEAGELLMTLVTDAKGQTWTGQKDLEGTDIPWGLPLGSYTVTQVKAGAGFALSTENAKPRSIEITWAGQEVPVIYRGYDVSESPAAGAACHRETGRRDRAGAGRSSLWTIRGGEYC